MTDAFARRTGRRPQDGGQFVPLPGAIFAGSGVLAYIANPPWIVVGAGPTVTTFINSMTPGTFDAGCPVPPAWFAGGFVGNRGFARFVGGTYALVNALGIAANVRADIYGVEQYQGAIPTAAASFHTYTDNGLGAQVSTWGTGVAAVVQGFGANMNPGGFFGGGAGALTNNPTLVGQTMYAGDLRRWKDGVNVATPAVGQVGTAFPMARLSYGAIPGGGQPGTVDMAEIVLAVDDANGAGHRVAYQNRVRALYPGIL